MVKIRMRKTMKRNKIKKQHQKHSRKHKKTIKQKRHHKGGKYSNTLRGGDICLKEVTKEPEVNRIGDGNANLAKKSSSGSLLRNLGSWFGNKKKETTPIEENKIIDKNKIDIENPLLSSKTEETIIVPPPPGPGDVESVMPPPPPPPLAPGQVPTQSDNRPPPPPPPASLQVPTQSDNRPPPPPPSRPNPYLNSIPNKFEDTTIEKSEIIEDSTSIPPPPPPAFKKPITVFDQIIEGQKLKPVSERLLPPAKQSELSKVADVYKERLYAKGLQQGDDTDDDGTDFLGGKTRRRRRKMKTKKRKSRPSRKMRKNKKTRK